MNSNCHIPLRSSGQQALCEVTIIAVRPLQTLLAAPCLLFLITLVIVLFRPPDLQFYALDRIAFLLLVSIVLLRAFLLRQPLPIVPSITLPMLLLLALALSSAISQSFDFQTWSLIAAKFIVPYTLFHVSMLVFADDQALRRFEIFSLLVLAYLCFIAIAFLVGAKALIFPRFILDESLGIHADRARGPFLQAVPNGVTLNMLGLIALDSFRRRRLRGFWALLLLLSLPLAILATMTRAVWISFAASILILVFRTASQRLRRACLSLVAAGVIGLGVVLCSASMQDSLQDRATERGPVEIRIGVYKAGWQMFLERPISGWGINQMPAELANRMTDYHLKAFWVHNTYLEILVEHGISGLALYAVIVVGLFRIGRKAPGSHPPSGTFLDDEFRKIWPLLVSVYLLNASFVVMNYQFVNGLLFTLAGMLAGQNQRRIRSESLVIAS